MTLNLRWRRIRSWIRLHRAPPTTETGFRGPQVCKLVRGSLRQLDYWARTDLLRPSIADPRGSGTQRRYAYRDGST